MAKSETADPTTPVATVAAYDDEPKKQVEATARLIAAAPRMLQLLQEIAVPDAFPLWDAERRALLREIEGA